MLSPTFKAGKEHTRHAKSTPQSTLACPWLRTWLLLPACHGIKTTQDFSFALHMLLRCARPASPSGTLATVTRLLLPCQRHLAAPPFPRLPWQPERHATLPLCSLIP